MTRKELDDLRAEIQRIDSDIIELISRRQEVALEIGLVKQKDNLGIKDREREKAVVKYFESRARTDGLDPKLGKALAELLMSISISEQKKAVTKPLRGRKAIVIGGAGKMGEWACRFLSTRGAEVTISDKRGSLGGYKRARSTAQAVPSQDIVIIASPLGTCPDDLEAVIRARPKGLVFDLCSVKSHIASKLQKGASQGLRITSVHPMFGPGAASPRGRNVIVCRCGSEEADSEAADLFASEGASVSFMSLDRHDELMAYVLGLSHLCTLVFVGTLARAGTDCSTFAQVQGPSFAKLRRMATELSNESRRVYHDIQALNPNTRHVVASMEGVLREVKRAALDDDPSRFRTIMDSDREYLEVS